MEFAAECGYTLPKGGGRRSKLFNLIMRPGPWNTGVHSMPNDRFFEYTNDDVIRGFRDDRVPNLDALSRLPCLFMEEGTDDEPCYVGSVSRLRRVGGEVQFNYTFDASVPPMTNAMIYANRRLLDMPADFEFHRNHWAVKDVDLYQFLLGAVRPRRQLPTVFRIAEHESIDPNLASAMMPFGAGFNPVWDAIKAATEEVNLRCRRADDIWENAAIIEDVVSLIDRSRIVICDCTGRNANVFYEAGIAHTLGRDVILLIQSEHDVPFDLRHLRYLSYHPNAEGLATMTTALAARLRTILGH